MALPELPYLPVDPPETLHPNAAFGQVDFEIVGVLGEGGMGRVLLARQKSLQRDVALKVLKPQTTRRDIVDSLLSEAIVTGSIEHPSIVPIHALGRDTQGRPVLVMKRIEGVSWRDLVRDPANPAWTTLAPDEGDRLDAHLDILMAVCNAAHFAHSRGFVHRDIKLANVMIGGFGEVYIVDWGIATRTVQNNDKSVDMTANDPPLGTPSYMAPEMAIGDRARIDARTDVYLLGATLHAVLTGKPRHLGETLLDVLLSARASLPFVYDADVPTELAAICNKAMDADPEKRFRSALELRQALSAFRRHRGSIALGNHALSRLEEVDALEASHGDVRALQLLAECRFGFMQALSTFQGNETARAGLDRCLGKMIEHEITQRDEEGARALLTELSEPRPDLEARINSLHVDIAKASAREDRLRLMERDADLSLNARPQFAILAIVPIFAFVAIAAFYRRGTKEPSPVALTIAASIFLALLLGAYLVARKYLQTAISRRAAAIVVLVPASMLLHRSIGLLQHTPVVVTLANDLIGAAIVAGAGAITVMPRFWWITLPVVLGAVAIGLFPGSAVDIFAITSGIGTVTLVVMWIRSMNAAVS